jgi:acetylserotonin N-methyltransferase
MSDRSLWAITQAALELPALVAAVRLGLFEALEKGPASVAELALKLDACPRATGTLVRFLASVGLIELHRDQAALTPVAALHLLQSSPSYWGGMFDRLSTLPLTTDALVRASRSGTSVIYGAANIWQEHERDQERARAFAEGAHCRAAYAAERIARLGLFESTATLLDVAGGKGTYSVAFCRSNPKLRARLLELGPASILAKRFVESAALAERIEIQTGDIFGARWPHGFDTVWLSDIFHDWSASQCADLASRAFDSLDSGGRILVNEVLLRDDRGGPRAATSYELAILLSTEAGRQYTFRELRTLLGDAGFSRPRIVARAGVYSVISATKPEPRASRGRRRDTREAKPRTGRGTRARTR